MRAGFTGIMTNSGKKKIPYLLNVDGNAMFVIPDYFQGSGKVYEYSINIHFEWKNDGAWHGIMGLYSPAVIEHMRYYCSKTGHDSTVQLAAMNQFDSGTTKSNLKDITSSGEHGKLTATYDLVNGVATFECGSYTYTTNFNKTHVVSGERCGGIFGSVDFPDKNTTTPSSYCPSTKNSRFYGFTQKVDGVLVHDYIPKIGGYIHDNVTGEDIYPCQGEVSYEEDDGSTPQPVEENLVYIYEYGEYGYEKTDTVCGTFEGDESVGYTINFYEEFGGGTVTLEYNEWGGYWNCWYSEGYCESIGDNVFSCYNYNTWDSIVWGF